jgi:hypothetical protein
MTDQSKPDRQNGDGLSREQVIEYIRELNECAVEFEINDKNLSARNLRRIADRWLKSLPARDAADGATGKQEEWAFCLPWSYDPGQGGSADEPEMPPSVGDADGLVLFSFVRREVCDDTEGELWWVNWHVQFPRLVEAVNTLGGRPTLDWSKACPQCGARPTDDCPTPRDCFDDAPAPPKPAPDAMREALVLAREEMVLAIAFLGRDVGTDRQTQTLHQIIARLATADKAARKALSAPVPPADGLDSLRACRLFMACLITKPADHPGNVTIVEQPIAASVYDNTLAAVSNLPPSGTRAAEPVARCPVCDWPMASDQSQGCIPGDCCYRPDDPAEQERIRKRRAELAASPVRGDRESIARLIDPETFRKYDIELASGRRAANNELWADVCYNKECKSAFAKADAILSLSVQPDAGEREALEPFATFGRGEDGQDIRDGLMRDRICDWFGPSDFDAARAAYSRQAPHSSSEGGR